MSQRRHDRNPTVTHARLYDRERCTAISDNSLGGAHRHTPTRFATVSGSDHLEITASLNQVHTLRLTALYVDLEVSCLEQSWKPNSGAAHLTTDQALVLGPCSTNLG